MADASEKKMPQNLAPSISNKKKRYFDRLRLAKNQYGRICCQYLQI
jgi:hypothetical protein